MAATSTVTRERTEDRTVITATPRHTQAQAPAKSKLYVREAQSILRALCAWAAQRSFAARLWDGTLERGRPGHTPEFTLVLKRPGALRRRLLPPTEIGVAEAYLRGGFDIEGDMEAATGLAYGVTKCVSSPQLMPRLVRELLLLPGDDLPAVRPRVSPAAHQDELGSRLWLAGLRPLPQARCRGRAITVRCG